MLPADAPEADDAPGIDGSEAGAGAGVLIGVDEFAGASSAFLPHPANARDPQTAKNNAARMSEDEPTPR